MKLVNVSKKVFIKHFGEEALTLLQQHDVAVYIAEHGMFPQIDAVGKAGGCVVRINPETLEILGEGATQLAMILYPENLREDAQALPENMREKFMASAVVHELKHVQQVEEARLSMKRMGLSVWEGEEYEMDLAGYVTFPWEREALIAQFTYLLGSEELAKTAYDSMQPES